jgi:hypothetical protein
MRFRPLLLLLGMLPLAGCVVAEVPPPYEAGVYVAPAPVYRPYYAPRPYYYGRPYYGHGHGYWRRW